MTDVIVVTTNNDIELLKETLRSLNASEFNILIAHSAHEIDELNPADLKLMCPKASHLESIFIATHTQDYMFQLYEAMYNNGMDGRLITFLKSGDIFQGTYFINEIESAFMSDPSLLAVTTNTVTKKDIALYSNRKLNLQGWFFKKDFLDYYTFLREFKNEVCFSLHLSYISDLQPQFVKYINKTSVYITQPISNIGEACRHYFNGILPAKDFFNPLLGTQYLYDIAVDCYISYVQATNLEIEEPEMTVLLSDIKTFYDYFKALELDNIHLLLDIYNQKIQKIYTNYVDNIFCIKIPNVTFIQFLEGMDNREEGV